MLRKRQIHLDFHTNGTLKVGDRFLKEQFQSALKAGCVDSITVFSKCHHGWSYHPTQANEMHPELDFDLLAAQLEACKEINVNAPVYISAGYDEKDYERRPDWRYVWSLNKDEQQDYENGVHFHLLCFNTGYLDVLCSQIEEVMVKYNPCGIFLDIISPKICYCDKCLADMKSLGLDYKNDKDCESFSRLTFDKYLKATNEAVRKHSETATIFHNSGHIPKGDHHFIKSNTHLELESLPTGGWGYDHFPLSAAYVRSLKNTEFLGMTGKFHESWGEFGGFKHPNALIYETSLSVASGGGCSIGDQLHPNGEMNMATYSLVGKAYSLIKEKEPWLVDAVNFADIAVLSVESITGRGTADADVGANRMLLEEKCLYNYIDMTMDISDYKLLILPETSGLNDDFVSRLNEYVQNGGKVIAAGEGLIKDGKFILDIGADYIGENEFTPTYLIPEFTTVNGVSEYVMRCKSYKFRSIDCEAFAKVQNPYFNRTSENFCSHMHAPNNPDTTADAAVIKGNVAYIGWDIFSAYATHGHIYLKELFSYILKRLIDDEMTVKTELPDRGVVTYTQQKSENRNILHLLYAHTTLRGKKTEVIEDVVPLFIVTCEVKVNSVTKRVLLVPSGENIEFEQKDGVVKFTVPVVNIHQMVSIEF